MSDEKILDIGYVPARNDDEYVAALTAAVHHAHMAGDFAGQYNEDATAHGAAAQAWVAIAREIREARS